MNNRVPNGSRVRRHDTRAAAPFFDSVICECDCITAPAEEGRKEGAKHIKSIKPYQLIYLWETTVNKSFTAITDPAGTPAHGLGQSTVAGPSGRQGPSGRSPAVGTYEGWVTTYSMVSVDMRTSP